MGRVSGQLELDHVGTLLDVQRHDGSLGIDAAELIAFVRVAAAVECPRMSRTHQLVSGDIALAEVMIEVRAPPRRRAHLSVVSPPHHELLAVHVDCDHAAGADRIAFDAHSALADVGEPVHRPIVPDARISTIDAKRHGGNPSVGGDVVGVLGEHRRVPPLALEYLSPQAIGGGDERVVGPEVDDEPRVRVELALELTGRPSRVADEHPQLVERHAEVEWVPAEVDGAEVADDRDPSFDRDGPGPAERDHGVGRHRAAGEHDGRRRREHPPLGKHVLEADLARPVQDDPERTFLAVLQHEDDRAIEVGVDEWWRRDEQPSAQRAVPVVHGPDLGTVDP